MLKINGKTFMNLQEAVQWLLDNNALPFQCSANYIANTEIGMGTIVNPSPAKVRIGSLIFFADSKVSTVIGLTENGFICSDQYNDLVDDIVYVSDVQLNASGHLIVTLSNGNTIDAGLIKQVSNFNINASQHLVANYNDGTSTDLGAIFAGNITISGDLTVTGSITGTIPFESIKDSAGHNRFIEGEINLANTAPAGITKTYGRWSLSGTHLLIVVAGNIADGSSWASSVLATLNIPQWIKDKIIPTYSIVVDTKTIPVYASDYSSQNLLTYLEKSGTTLGLTLSNFTATKDRMFRIAFDLLIDNA